MSEQMYQIILTGRLISGHSFDEVESALSLLLKMPVEKVRHLLRGDRSRIKTTLPLLRAERLKGKIERRGAECEIEAVAAGVEPAAGEQRIPRRDELDEQQSAASSGVDVVPLEAAPIETDDLELSLPDEIPAPTLDADDSLSAAQDDDAIVLATPEAVESPEPRQETDDGATEQFYEVPSSRNTDRNDDAKPNSERLKLVALGAVLVVGALVAVWMYWGSAEEPAPQVVQVPAPVKPAYPKKAATARGMVDLAKSVRVWMIQYGSGFDPAQVTLERLQQDLGISSEHFVDGWGQAYEYAPQDMAYQLRSAGPDRSFDTADDIRKEFKLKR